MHIFFSDFLRFDMSILLLTVTLRGYLISIAYCLFFHFAQSIDKRFRKKKHDITFVHLRFDFLCLKHRSVLHRLVNAICGSSLRYHQNFYYFNSFNQRLVASVG